MSGSAATAGTVGMATAESGTALSKVIGSTADNGQGGKVVLAGATKHRLKAAPEYKYRGASKATAPSSTSMPPRKP